MNFVPESDSTLKVSLGYYVGNSYIGRNRTICCALGQLSLGNNTDIKDIALVLEQIRKETYQPISSLRRDGGERAIFVITLPEEKNLEKNLEDLGFKMIYEFHRRACFPEADMLKMWIISW